MIFLSKTLFLMSLRYKCFIINFNHYSFIMMTKLILFMINIFFFPYNDIVIDTKGILFTSRVIIFNQKLDHSNIVTYDTFFLNIVV
jgi:aspartokinase-like uncharacterized kinase